MEHMARRRSVSIAAAPAPPLPDVAADPNQVQQVLINLIVNALEATPRGGRIGIEAWACPNDGRAGVAVAVSDTGSGIPADALGHVFEPFFTTKPQGQGTGLGLPICRDILREHGGTLAVQSRAGPGHDVHRLAAGARGGGVSAPRVLVVDNDPEMLAMLRRHLESEGLAVAGGNGRARGPRRHCGRALRRDPDRPHHGRRRAVSRCSPPPRRRAPATRVLLMTAFGSLETAIEAMRQGAYDYLTKPFKLAEVTHAVRRAVDDQRLREENARLRAEVERQFGFERVVGRSRAIQAVLEQVRAVADSDASVLLLGESGTGKELVARALHWSSARRAGPFVPVNCAAVPETLLESELFGHEKGAFTGADRKRTGSSPRPTGARSSSTRSATSPSPPRPSCSAPSRTRRCGPSGAARTYSSTCASSPRPIAIWPTLVQDGRFREDLYYRLAVIPIRLPAAPRAARGHARCSPSTSSGARPCASASA